MDLQAAPSWALWAAAAFGTIALLSFGGAVFLLVLWLRGGSHDLAPAQVAPMPRQPTGGQSGDTGPLARPPALENTGRFTQQTEVDDRASQPTEAEHILSNESIETVAETRIPLGEFGRGRQEWSGDLSSLAMSVRSAIVTALINAAPANWVSLILSPPANARQMIWHVHPRVGVALDLADGRTVPTYPPPPTHEWTTPSGRRAGQATGDPRPAPGPETTVVRVSGPYLSVTYQAGPPGGFAVRVSSPTGDAHELRARGDDPASLQPVLADALATIIRDPRQHESVAMGYRPTSWTAHDRTWLHVLGA